MLEKQLKNLILGMLSLVSLTISIFATFYFFYGFTVMAAALYFMVLACVFWAITIKMHSLEKLIIMRPIFYFLCNIIIVFNSFILIKNGSPIICIFFFIVPLSMYFFIGEKTSFIYAVIASILFIGTFYCSQFLSEFDVMEFTPQQVYFFNNIAFITFTAMFIYSFFCIYRVKNTKQQIMQEKTAELKNGEYEKLQNLYSAAVNLIERKKLYENPDLTMQEVAEYLQTNATYIYRALKQNGITDSFPNFINRFRIKAVKDRIESGEIEHYKLSYICSEVGFRQQSSFNKIFRQCEGMTPSAYIQLCKSRKRKMLKQEKQKGNNN